jgi:cytochrome bd-type quinol oxidase subunit 2
MYSEKVINVFGLVCRTVLYISTAVTIVCLLVSLITDESVRDRLFAVGEVAFFVMIGTVVVMFLGAVVFAILDNEGDSK